MLNLFIYAIICYSYIFNFNFPSVHKIKEEIAFSVPVKANS